MKNSPSKNVKIITNTPKPPSPYVEKTIKKSLIKLLGNLDLKSRGVVIQYLTILSKNGLYYFDVTRVLLACKEAIVHFECQDDEIENNYKYRSIPKYYWADDLKGQSQSSWVLYDLKTCNKLYRAELNGVPYIAVDKERFFDTTRHLQVRFDNHSRVRMGKKEEIKPKDNSKYTYKWYWLGDKVSNGERVWEEYSSTVCDRLEQGYVKQSQNVSVDNERFVDTKSMNQKRKDAQYRMRPVKREKVAISSGNNNNTPDINSSDDKPTLNKTPISTPTKSTPSTPSLEDTPSKSIGLLSMLFGQMKTSDQSPAKSMASTILDKISSPISNQPNRIETIYGLTRDQHSNLIVILEKYLDSYPEKNEHNIARYKKASGFSDFTTLYPIQAVVPFDSKKDNNTTTSNNSITSTTTTTSNPTTNSPPIPAKKEISQACEVIINSVIQLVMKNNLINQKSTIYLSYNL